MSKPNTIHKLTGVQQSQVMDIFSQAVYEASYHIRKIRATGHNLFTRYGIEVTLKMALARRSRCMKLFHQVFRGFVEDRKND